MALWRAPFIAVLYEHFPPAIGILQSIQIESQKIIEKITLDLTTKDVYL